MMVSELIQELQRAVSIAGRDCLVVVTNGDGDRDLGAAVDVLAARPKRRMPKTWRTDPQWPDREIVVVVITK